MRRLPPFTCSRCGRPVLNLHGQDALLPAYAVPPDALDELREAGAHDFVHIRCLVDSGYDTYWTHAIADTRARAPGTNVVFDVDNFVVMRHERTGDKLVVGHGSLTRLLAGELVALQGGSQETLIPIDHEINIDLRAVPELCDAIQDTFRKRDTFSLMDVIDTFDIRDLMVDVEALRGGSLEVVEDEPEATWSAFELHSLCATARYRLRVPAEALQAVYG